jgi:hypothetical protein
MAEMKIRLPDELRAAIEKAAEAREVSMNAEIIHRLERSFAEEDFLDRVLGNDQSLRTMALLMISNLKRGGELAARANGHPEWGPGDWLANSSTYRIAAQSVIDALGMNKPKKVKVKTS